MTFTLQGAFNARDLGGLPLINGGQTRSGVFFRSDAPSRLTPADEITFADDVDSVVDLRTDIERSQAPDNTPKGVEILHKPLLGGSWAPVKGQAAAADQQQKITQEQMQQFVNSLPSLSDLYIEILKEGSETFAQIASLVANGRRTLIHCTAGKDRTGVGAALVLDAVGVRREAIIEDYSKTHNNLSGAWSEAMIANLEKQGLEMNDKLMDLLTASPAGVMESTLETIDATYGGSVEYLRSGGLSDEDLSGVRGVLVK